MNDAVRYLIFLVDADRLFDTALGMYDFSLVLLIAQHAQKVSALHVWLIPPFALSPVCTMFDVKRRIRTCRTRESISRSCESYGHFLNIASGSGLTTICGGMQKRSLTSAWLVSSSPLLLIPMLWLTLFLNPWTGPDCFEEALEYVEQHRLYEKALAIWKEEDAEQQYKVSLAWLQSR